MPFLTHPLRSDTESQIRESPTLPFPAGFFSVVLGDLCGSLSSFLPAPAAFCAAGRVTLGGIRGYGL